MDLFEHQFEKEIKTDAPLAERLRPQSFDEFLGQEKIFGEKSVLRKRMDKGESPSLILWGPPGTGKTTFARLIQQKVKAFFVEENATELGAKRIREIAHLAQRRRFEHQQKTILFIDEIHRLNRAQQDLFLPFIEKGAFVLIGATTENPSFELNAALLSRMQLLVFKALESSDLLKLAEKALEVGHYNFKVHEENLQWLATWAEGDARRFLGGLDTIIFELASRTPRPDTGNQNNLLSEDEMREILGRSVLRYSKDRDDKYDTVSVFIKSIRGSDPDAGLYYLARLVEAGEDPVYIARRLVILASEDIGNADPQALGVAVNGLAAVQAIGLPECAINLAQVVTYLASVPKSNRSYLGLRKAQEEVSKSGDLEIPLSVRNAPTRLMKDLGYSQGYQYAHNSSKGWLPQQFLPEKIKELRFYEPLERGFEKRLKEYLEWVKKQENPSS